ncbi:hypothetical protein DDB_G0286263 [Dictyostelium discoideum AX4]|uniref:Uncharacterized protein n=1 Tax=Dictyostelium discoideum TaxID=44689 RepID=Q54M15_DICDI|nr:hypothetical protein DDB_G0286263 [Dictyostelium discoideum AX4]EAL64307.1 hypothetical protein DDB_G0286263 [Dictyostelium discoideum AX4]|eukprot:XP_637816.1 hypothetical protein DDB_G0286263 [Dictyostelium discoideum AX4]
MFEINNNNNSNIKIIKSNIIFKKILEYCWEQDDLKKLFHWSNHTKLEDPSFGDLIKHTQIREATKWKLSLMRVSYQFLTIILSNFEFNLSNSKFFQLLAEKENQQSLDSHSENKFETTNTSKTDKNNLDELFKKQKFYSMEDDMINIIDSYESFGDQWFIETFGNLSQCFLYLNEESLFNKNFFKVISMIGSTRNNNNNNLDDDDNDDDNCSITLIFQYSFENRKSIDFNVTKLLFYYEHEIMNRDKKKLTSNIKTLIFEFMSSMYINPYMVYSQKLFYECGLENSVKSIYAFNQPHLTFLPYFFRDCKQIELMSLHTDYQNTYGRAINNVSQFSNKLQEMSLSILDDNLIDEYVPNIGYYFSPIENPPPKHFTLNIILKDDQMCNDIFGSGGFNDKNNNSVLESLSISIDKLNLKFFKPIENNNNNNNKLFPNLINKFSIRFYFSYMSTPLDDINYFSKFFSSNDFQNVKYFNFTILIDFKKTQTININTLSDEDQLLEILFEKGLKYSSLQFISIDFKYDYIVGGKCLSFNLLSKLLNSISSNKNIKGILFAGLDISITNLPDQLLNFSLYPFSLNENENKKSIYYFIQ